MVTRHNLCTNPALAVNNTGWSGNGTLPVRTDVTSEGYGRQWGARYIDGTFARTATGAVTPGLTYTLSAYRYFSGPAGAGGNQVYIEWNLSVAGPVYTQVLVNWTALTLERVSISGTAPANAVSAGMLLDGPYVTRPADVSMLLIEQVGTLDSYFDGATPGATWDGVAGNSASTWITSAFVPGPPMEVVGELNRLAKTVGRGEQGAANIYAGTTGLETVGALNVKAGTTGLDMQGVCNKLAGTTGLGTVLALSLIATPP